MDAETRAHLKQLLEGQRVLSLAVLVDQEPTIGLLPFAIVPDHSRLLVHVSSLAKHAQGLFPGARASILIHQSEEAVGDPLQVPRVTLDVHVKELRRGSPEYEEAKTRYLARFPQAAVTFGLGDFKLLELRFSSGRFVEGFARAVDISADDLRAMTAPESPHTESQSPHLRGFWKAQED